MTDEELKTAKQWLKEGFVPRPNAEGQENTGMCDRCMLPLFAQRGKHAKSALSSGCSAFEKKENAQAKLYREHKKIW